jgi:hypothetical protein
MRMKFRARASLVILVAGAALVALLLSLLPAAKGQLPLLTPSLFPSTATESADPLPLQRILVPADRVTAELERARSEVLVQMPRDDFEARVKQAARAGIALLKAPRLVEARYRATLQDTALVGTGQWTLLNPGPTAALFALQPFNLALRRALIGKKDAILGDLDSKGLSLLLEQPGRQTVALDWSVRGDPGPAGVRFKLEVPSCALTSFELELPADQLVTPLTRATGLLSGPRPAAVPGRSLWRLECAGYSQVELLVRPATGAGPPPLVLARLQTRQHLTADRLEAAYDCTLEVPHGSLRDLNLEYDPSLRPLAVTVRDLDLENWEVKTGGPPGAAALLHLRFAEPFQGGTLTLHVRGLAPVLADRPWTSPWLRPVGAIPRGETLLLRVAPEVRLDEWQPGGFDLAKAETEGDGGQVLTLQEGLRDPATAARQQPRPGAVVRLQETDFHVRQLAWWRIGPAETTLTAQLAYEVERGTLFRLPVRLPSGWRVDQVDLTPADRLGSWAVVAADEGETLVVDLQSPVEAGTLTLLTVALRPEQAEPPLTFPQLAPKGVGQWEGALAISIDPYYQATVQASVPAVAPVGARERDRDFASRVTPPWGSQALDYYYPYRAHPVTGTIQLRPRPPRVKAQCTSEVILASGRAALRTRLVLQPEVGNVDGVDLSVSGPAPVEWDWRVEGGRNSVRGLQRLRFVEEAPRLLVLGAGGPLQATSLLALPSRRDTIWRLTLAEPVREPVTLEAVFDLHPQSSSERVLTGLAALAAGRPLELAALAAPGARPVLDTTHDQRWEVPLVSVLTADPMVGEVRLHLAGTDRVQVDAEGMRETLADSRAGSPSVWRTYRYGHPPVALVLHGQVTAGSRAVPALADHLRLTTYVEAGGRLLHHFHFRVQDWKQRTLPVRLPRGAKLQAARVDGRWVLSPELGEAEDDGSVVLLPVPGGTAGELEVVYLTEVPDWKLWAVLEAPMPALPLHTGACRRTWCLLPGLVPLDEGRYHHPAGPQDGQRERGPSLVLPRTRLELSNPETRTPRGPSDVLPFHPFPADAWEPLAGEPALETLAVVRADALPILACVLTAFILLAGWRARFWPARRRYAVLLSGLAVAGLAMLWLPDTLRSLAVGPFVAAVALGCFWYLWTALKPRPQAAAGTLGAVVGALLALAGTAALPGQAADPRPYIIRLLPGPAGMPQKQMALVPPEVLEQLRALARQGAQGLEGIVLLSARYGGVVANGAAEFQAEFQAHAFGEEPAVLPVPLDGVELREASLDGAAAYPLALAAPQAGYSVSIKGRGRHSLRLRFNVPLQGTADDPELRIKGVPELVQSQLTLSVPAGAQYLHAVFGQGAERVTADAGATRLEADLGRVKTLQVRWRQEGTQPPPAQVQVTELYLWDLKATQGRLMGVLQYTVSRGAVTQFAIDLPANMEVRRVEANSLSGAGLPPRLREWKVADAAGRRQLQLKFQSPVSAGVEVFLELVPTLPLGPSVTLALPVPQGTSLPTEGLVGYRVEGRQADLVDYLRVTGIHPEEFALVWQSAGTDDRGPPPERAYRFQRGPEGAPLLRLNLRAAAAPLDCNQDLTWHLGRGRAELRATARLTAAQGDLALVAWEVPPEVVVANVRGPEVHGWSRTGSHLQVWLQRSTSRTTLELTGWLALRPDQVDAPLRLPGLAVTGAASHWTTLRVLADKGLALREADRQNLLPMPDLGLSLAERVYGAKGPTFSGTFQVSPAPANAAARILTLAEVEDRSLRFSTTITYEIHQGELRTVTVQLRNWEGPEVRLEADRVASRREYGKDPTNRAWTLDLQPGVTGRYQVQLTGSLPLEAVGETLMPEVSVAGVTTAERWLAVAGRQLLGEEPRGLTLQEDAVAALTPWPAAAARWRQGGGWVWKVQADDWRLRLRTSSPLAEIRPVQVFLDEQSAAVRDGRHWTHQADYLLYHEAGTELSIRLPAGAELARLTLDGHEVLPLLPDPEHLWLPLTGGSGPRHLWLSWTFPDGRERLAEPDLRKPILEDAVSVTDSRPNVAGWAVTLPTGYVVSPSTTGAVADSAIGWELRRAAAQVHLSGVLAEDTRGKADASAQQLVAAQEEFYRCCHTVATWLATMDVPTAGSRNSQALSTRLTRLREMNEHRAQVQHFEKVRLQAEKRVAAESAVAAPPSDEDGALTYWQAGSGSVAPRLRLIAVAEQRTQQAAGLSGLLLLVLLIAWFLSYFPRLVAWLQVFWPEQLVLLGSLGWLTLAPSPAFVLPVVAGLGARLVYWGRWVSAFIRRVKPVAAAGGSGNSGST